MKPAVFLTGATGFLGMEVLARLLEAGDRDVLALVARRDDAAARAAPRRRAGDAVGRPRALPGARHRRPRRAHAGGARPRRPPRRGRGAHPTRCCTAQPRSPSTCRSRRRARSTSTAPHACSTSRSTRRRRGGLERFLHVSTAYVAGRHEGAFRERQLDAGQSFRNTYEQTKADAEQIVAMARELGPAIARPSIVMGECDSGWTPAFNVLYWPLQAFSRGLFKERAGAAQRARRHRPGRLRGGRPRAPARPPRGGRVQPRRRAQRVAGRRARPRLASEYFGKPLPPFVEPIDPDADDDHDSVYVPYFDMRVVFDDARARSVLVPAGIEAPPLPRLLRAAHGVRQGGPLGQDEDHARGGAEPPGGARRDLSSESHMPGYRGRSLRRRSASGTSAPSVSRAAPWGVGPARLRSPPRVGDARRRAPRARLPHHRVGGRPASPLDWPLDLAPVRGFFSPGALESPTSELASWPVETSGSPSPSHARSASAGTTRRISPSGTTRTASRCASTAVGAAGTPGTARPAREHLRWPETDSAPSSDAGARAAPPRAAAARPRTLVTSDSTTRRVDDAGLGDSQRRRRIR